jgi:IS5 family transposase
VVTVLRTEDLRRDKPTLGIIDAHSVQNADTAQAKGYDAGKKVSGIKRPIVVDPQGLPHAVLVTTANVPDRDGAVEMLTAYRETLSSVRKYLVDGGYYGGKVRKRGTGTLRCGGSGGKAE